MVLYFSRMDTVSSANDQVALATIDTKVTLIVQRSKVSRLEQAPGRHRASRCGGLAEVPGHQIEAPNGDLPLGAVGHLNLGLIQDVDVDSFQRAAHGCGPLLRSVGPGRHGHGGSRFGEAIRDLEIRHDSGPDLVGKLRRHGRSSDEAGAQGRQIRRLAGRVTQQHHEHRRDTMHHRRLLGFDEIQDPGNIEALLQDQSRARDDRRQQGHSEPEDVEQGHAAQRAVRIPHAQASSRRPGRPEQAVVRLHDPLVLRGSACREQHGERIGRIDIRRDQRVTTTGGDQVFELEDPVIVPQVLFTHRDQVLKARKFGE